jgi:tetratricopeptide (TPR) repeat protein
MTEGGASESEYREQGNAEYRSGNYLRAAALYTKALKENPECAPLYSNRSIALLQLNKLPKALADAEMCISLAPTWDKGHFRKGMVLEALNRLEDVRDCSVTSLAPI